jgi:hypothetical protein
MVVIRDDDNDDGDDDESDLIFWFLALQPLISFRPDPCTDF